MSLAYTQQPSPINKVINAANSRDAPVWRGSFGKDQRENWHQPQEGVQLTIYTWLGVLPMPGDARVFPGITHSEAAKLMIDNIDWWVIAN